MGAGGVQLEKRRLRESLITPYNTRQEVGASTRGNSLELHQGGLRLDVSKKFLY